MLSPDVESIGVTFMLSNHYELNYELTSRTVGFYAFTAGFILSELETFTKIFIAYFRETITLYAVIINSRRIMVCKYFSYQLSYVTCFLFNRAVSLLIMRLNCIILEQYTDLVVKRIYQNNSTNSDPFPPIHHYILLF